MVAFKISDIDIQAINRFDTAKQFANIDGPLTFFAKRLEMQFFLKT